MGLIILIRFAAGWQYIKPLCTLEGFVVVDILKLRNLWFG